MEVTNFACACLRDCQFHAGIFTYLSQVMKVFLCVAIPMQVMSVMASPASAQNIAAHLKPMLDSLRRGGGGGDKGLSTASYCIKAGSTHSARLPWPLAAPVPTARSHPSPHGQVLGRAALSICRQKDKFCSRNLWHVHRRKCCNSWAPTSTAITSNTGPLHQREAVSKSPRNSTAFSTLICILCTCDLRLTLREPTPTICALLL